MRNALGQGIKDLFPGYFALVMATGIVSIASFLLGMGLVAWTLFYINLVAFGVLWVLMLIRLVWYPRRVWADLTSHVRGPGFFTLVAATCVLGSQWVILNGNLTIAVPLWGLGILLWLVVNYIFFTAVIVHDTKPGLDTGINGAWLIAVVAVQSISVLGTLVAGAFAPWHEVVLFFTLSMYLLGCMLYLLIIVLIFYRFIFFVVTPQAMAPPYWISMGSIAITTLAGATLILNADQWVFLQEIRPFLLGFTLFFWAMATWWIPLLLILGAWRHLYKRFRLSYDPQYWGMVFPLGMYTTCTFQLSKAIQVPFLMAIPEYFVYVALLAWLAAFAGMVAMLVKSMVGTPSGEGSALKLSGHSGEGDGS